MIRKSEILEYVKCNLCGSDLYKVLYSNNESFSSFENNDFNCTSAGHGSFGSLVECKKCGLIYRNPREKADLIINLYENIVDNVYEHEIKGRYETFKNVLNFVSLFVSQGPMCDVGCYTGAYLEIAKNRGWRSVYGIEPSLWASNKARDEKKLNVITGDVGDIGKFNLKFKVVTLWDVLEHFTEPLQELKTISKFIEKDGYLFLSTMDISSLFAKVMGKYWPWFMRMHLYYFTPKTIRELLTKSGFETIYIRPYTHIVSTQYLFYKFLKRGFFLRYKDLDINKMSSLFRYLNFYIPVNLGDFMLVVARKR